MENRLEESQLGDEANDALNRLVTVELAMFVEETSDDILHMSYLSEQSGIRSVVHNDVEQVMLDLLFKEVIGETLDDQTARLFDTNAAANRLPKKFLTLSSLSSPIATFV